MKMAFNKKAMEMNFQLVSFILVAALLVIAAFAFVPDVIDTAKEFFEGLGFGFEEEAIPEQVIDEERIDAETPISISSVEQDTDSGLTIIIKQVYGEGWNLEVEKTVFDTFSERYTGPGWLLLYLTSGEDEPLPILPNKKLSEILASDKTRGKIEVDGKTYIHIAGQTGNYNKKTAAFYWFKDTNNNEAYDGEEFTDTNTNGCWDEGEPLTDTNSNKEYDGECITIEDLTKIILADLYTQATEE